jgi:hypothetical protein
LKEEAVTEGQVDWQAARAILAQEEKNANPARS